MAAKRKSNKKVTYAEFLAWLEGVESMQENDWTPTPTQWQTVRAKLNTVKPTVEIKEVIVEPTGPVSAPAQVDGPITTMGPSTFEAPAPMMPQQSPVPLRPQLSAHQKPSEHEGVPASVNGPFVDSDGNLMGDEFL